jgi:hypothetical protein
VAIDFYVVVLQTPVFVACVPLCLDGYGRLASLLYSCAFALDIIDDLMEKLPIHPENTTIQKKSNGNKKWVTMTFFGKETYYISKIFKHTNLQIAFKTKKNSPFPFKFKR